MADDWASEEARERLKIGMEYDPDGLISYSVDLARALDWITELEALLVERERTVTEQAAWGLAMETERNQAQRLYDAQSAEVVRLRAALAFYADPANYILTGTPNAMGELSDWAPHVLGDDGERARAAL